MPLFNVFQFKRNFNHEEIIFFITSAHDNVIIPSYCTDKIFILKQLNIGKGFTETIYTENLLASKNINYIFAKIHDHNQIHQLGTNNIYFGNDYDVDAGDTYNLLCNMDSGYVIELLKCV